MENEKIYVFDAYGTLFDVDHACKEMAIQLGDNWEKLSSIWRQKQLEYSWLHNSMNEYDSFWKITKDSLEYAMNSLSMNSVKIKNELLDLYFKISAFEEVEEVLKKIKKNKIKTAILSNGSYDMLNSAVKNSKFDELINEVISVDECKKFKPHKDVYNLVIDKFNTNKKNCIFFSSNCWDIHGASNFGFQTVWVNRKKNIDELLPGKVDDQVQSLKEYFFKV
jgi:2-haloacid dehalogenase